MRIGWRGAARRTRGWDGSLLAVIAGFAVAMPLFSLAGNFTSGLSALAGWLQANPVEVYSEAVAAAALKRPDFKRDLVQLDRGAMSVKVVNFGRPLERSVQGQPVERKFPVWVALEADVRAACRGAADPLRAIQQVLGLPPGPAGLRVVNTFTVPASGLFRPCMSGGDVTTQSCEFGLPQEPAPDADAQTLRKAYDHLRFVAGQMWNSYWGDFPREEPPAKDYPAQGVPFTGMGWSYHWGAGSGNMGVTEFVVPGNQPLSDLKALTPEEFCAP